MTHGDSLLRAMRQLAGRLDNDPDDLNPLLYLLGIVAFALLLVEWRYHAITTLMQG